MARLALLIATAIQGIAPDAEDLASLRALRLICPIPYSPTDPTEDGDSPDDVCGSVQLEMNLRVRRADDVPLPWLLPADLRSGFFLPTFGQSPFLSCRTWGLDLQIHTLCRLTC
jgi:hypothetical protein